MWEDVSYCWVVVCKNNLYHIPRNFIYRHKIPLGHTDAVTSRPLCLGNRSEQRTELLRTTTAKRPFRKYAVASITTGRIDTRMQFRADSRKFEDSLCGNARAARGGKER